MVCCFDDPLPVFLGFVGTVFLVLESDVGFDGGEEEREGTLHLYVTPKITS